MDNIALFEMITVIVGVLVGVPSGPIITIYKKEVLR